MPAETMRAVRFHEYGGAEMLVLEHVRIPSPHHDQVLIRMKAAGVNPADWKLRSGRMKEIRPVPLPWIVGLDGSGVVQAVGPGVTGFKPGDPVFGPIRNSYADYAVASTAEVVEKPSTLTFEEAAAVPVGALTAWQMVCDAGLKAGQRVLVQGGAGGVGLFVVQFARLKDATPYATASRSNLSYLQSIGVKVPIDYSVPGFEEKLRDIDVIFDTVGGDALARLWEVIKPGGTLVTIAATPSEKEAARHNVHAIRSGRAGPGELPAIASLLSDSRVKPEIEAIYPLEQAQAAHRQSETGHGRGRIVLKIAD